MVQSLQAKEINLRYLISNFGIQLIENEQFFPEWQDDLPEVSDFQKRQLDQVKAGFLNLQSYPPLSENIVRMAVLDPLLFIGEFYLTPFGIKAEEPIELATEDEGVVIKGRIDTLILKDQFWIMVIEAKRSTYSVEAGLAQILAYMLANPFPDRPSYGMIATGGEFIFLKLLKEDSPKYSTSNVFHVRNRGNELYQVLQIMKKISQIVMQNARN